MHKIFYLKVVSSQKRGESRGANRFVSTYSQSPVFLDAIKGILFRFNFKKPLFSLVLVCQKNVKSFFCMTNLEASCDIVLLLFVVI
jgi:hypothetical protein